MFSYQLYEKFRIEKNLKDADVARLTGLPPNFFSEWKSGKANPKADKIFKISKIFGITFEDLFVAKEE